MILPPHTHVAVADGERFVMMRSGSDTAAIELTALGTPEVSDTNRSAGMRHQDSGTSGSEDMDEFAHAAGVAEYLNHAVLTQAISDLVVIADPVTLGEMRKHYHGKLREALVGELPKTLTSHSSAEIAAAIAAA